MGARHLLLLVRMSRICQHHSPKTDRVISGSLTGGCSSVFSPTSGFAARFANTPSDPDPPPYTLVVLGVKMGNCVGRLSTCGRSGSPSVGSGVGIRSTEAEAGEPRINLCLSSPSFSSSLSAPPASNVSASVWSTGWELCREVGEEARERKEGGGEEGVWGVMGLSSSCPDT